MQRLKVFLVTAIKSVLAKLKRLAIHIFKHPFGSIWWAIKMYFALMFFSLFVACSFGAFASTPTTGTCKVGTPLEGVGCVTTAPIKSRYTIKWNNLSGSGQTAIEARDSLLSAWGSLSNVCNVNGTTSREVIEKYPLVEPSPPKNTSTGFKGRTTCNYTVFNTTTKTDEAKTSKSEASYTGISIIYGSGAVCPPEGVYKDFTLSHTKEDGTELCYKPFDIESCFADPKYSVANQYHFAPQDAGKGSICVDTDNIGLCPFVELDGGKGVFVPDRDSTFPCGEEPPSTPMPPPEPPENCTTTPSGMKVCKEDPNDKCTANSSGALSCGESCGYMNNVFVCFENPDVDPEQPEEPDVPRPPKDDNIENPDKPIADMLKKDFKDVQRGVESRLDGFAADMANLIKTEKAAKDQENKNSAQGNKLLNSINQNTADTVKELKKINEGTVAGSIEKPEFGEKNDWNQRNFGTVLKGKVDELGNLPIIKSATAFFDVSFAGSCPVYNVSVWVFEIQIDQFCSAEMQAIFPYIKAVVLLIAAFLAFRVAFL